jgi:MFS family permease
MQPSILRQPLFVRYFVAFFVSAIGTWVQSFVQSWLVYTQTGNDPIFLGWLSLAFAGPLIALTPIGGAIADHVNKRTLLLTTQALQAVCAAMLTWLAWRGQLGTRHILGLQVCAASLLAIDNPARQSLLPELVPRELLQVALSMNAAIFTGAALIGPAIGGALYMQIPVAGLFAINSLSFILPLGALASFPSRLGRPIAKSKAERSESIAQFLWKTPNIRNVLLLAAAIALFGRSFNQLLAAYTREMLGKSAFTFGSLLASGGIGALLGAAIMTVRAQKATSHLSTVSPMLAPLACAIGVLLAVLSRVHTPLLARLTLASLGCAATMFTTAVSTTLQLSAPPKLRGRILSLHIVTVIGFPYLGALGLALVMRPYGAPSTLLVSALACILVSCIAHLTIRAAERS